tara:strand:- start:24 stop:1472 length:1449 start_codon:yes stop_codon:yes gene_type:complete
MKFKDYIDPTPQIEELVERDLGDKTPGIHLVVLGLGDEEGTFADVIEQVSKKKGIKYTLVNVEEAYIADSDLEIGEITFHNFDGEDKKITIHKDKSIIFVRAGAIQTLVSQALVSTLGTYGFFLINDLESMILCDNKLSSTITLDRYDISTPKTAMINNVKSIENAHLKIGGKFPVIIKTLTGTQGVGVSKVNDMASLVSVAQSLWKFDAQLLIQQFLDIKSDIRTLVINGNIIGSAERIKQDDKEFRNNVHLGAKTVPYNLSNEEKELIRRAARSSGTMYCGVDHCKVGKDLYILEINGSPGIRSSFMGYDPVDGKSVGKKTDLEIFELILDYYSYEIHRRPLYRTEAGYVERIMIEGLDSPVRAKLDTGNGTTATMLHVDKLELDGDTAHWTKNGQKFKNEIVDISLAKHLETIDKRPVVELSITFNNKQYTVPFGLTTRDSASEMLVNRDLLSTFRVSVNPNRKFILSDWVPRNDRTDV